MHQQSKVKQLRLSGSPYEIGHQHGTQAQQEVLGSIEFYKAFLHESTKLEWSAVKHVASQFEDNLRSKWPEFVEEMQGVADGAKVDFHSILALNVRTEIAYGMAADGCTAFGWKTADTSYLAQNWDWRNEQQGNVFAAHITQPGKPTIHMMTEGGIIGKIGLNSEGVGCTLNAIRANGVSFDKLPTHLALRAVLNSTTRKEAEDALRGPGVASACHIQIADQISGTVGFECTSNDIVEIPQDSHGVTIHSNHLIKQHQIKETALLTDSPFRLERIDGLIKGVKKPAMDTLGALLKDEENFPAAICRAASEKSSLETLFSIVMNLTEGFAEVKMGRPTEDGEHLVLRA